MDINNLNGTSGRASLTNDVWYYLDCYYDGTNTYGIKTSTDGEEWTDFLNEEYGSFDYPSEVNFVKGLGYRVFRNSDGKHKIIYESDVIEL